VQQHPESQHHSKPVRRRLNPAEGGRANQFSQVPNRFLSPAEPVLGLPQPTHRHRPVTQGFDIIGVLDQTHPQGSLGSLKISNRQRQVGVGGCRYLTAQEPAAGGNQRVRDQVGTGLRDTHRFRSVCLFEVLECDRIEPARDLELPLLR
jgi:hypothetical protein